MLMNRIAAVLSLLALLGSVSLASAADRYHFSLTVTGKTTNELGAMVTISTSSSRLIREVAEDLEVSPTTLAMIYERSTGKVLIVDRDNGETLGEVITFETDVSVSNVSETLSQVYFQISNAEEENFKGSGVGTAKITRDSVGAERTFKFNGKLFVAIEAVEDDTGTEVFTGVFSTGSVFVPRIQ
jgi:hypothetical protein